MGATGRRPAAPAWPPRHSASFSTSAPSASGLCKPCSGTTTGLHVKPSVGQTRVRDSLQALCLQSSNALEHGAACRTCTCGCTGGCALPAAPPPSTVLKALEDAPAPAAAGASLLGDADLAKHEPDLQCV